MTFFDKTRKLTTDELKSLASLCAGAAFLLVIALVLSGSLPLPESLRLAVSNINQTAATANAAAVPYWAGQGTQAGVQSLGYTSSLNYYPFPSPMACYMNWQSGSYTPNCFYPFPGGILSAIKIGSSVGTYAVSAHGEGGASPCYPGTGSYKPYGFVSAGTAAPLVVLSNTPVELDWACQPNQHVIAYLACGDGWEYPAADPIYTSGYITDSLGHTFPSAAWGVNVSQSASGNGTVIGSANTAGLIGSTTVTTPSTKGTTTNYYLYCSAGGVNTLNVTVPVTTSPASLSLTPSPSAVTSGGTSRLDWAVDNVQANACNITGLASNVNSYSYSWAVPSDWNNSNNTVEVIGGGGAGGGALGTQGTAVGGGGGAYSKTSNVSLTPGGTTTYRIGLGGTGVANTTGNTGGDTIFNGTGTTCDAAQTTEVCAKGGSGGTGAAAGGAGGASGSGVGGTKNSGGAGGSITGGATRSVTGGGGAAGLNGAGNNGGSTGAGFTATNGGSGDAGSGGTAGTGSTSGAPTAGGNGTEWGASDGSGGGGGGNYGTSGVAAGGAGGNYGGGGGGGQTFKGTSGIGGAGIQGLVVITYTPSGGPQKRIYLTAQQQTTSGSVITPALTQTTVYSLVCIDSNNVTVSTSTTVTVVNSSLSVTATDNNSAPQAGTVALDSNATTTVAWSSVGANASSCTVKKYRSDTNSTSTISSGAGSGTWDDGPFVTGGTRRFTFSCNDTNNNPITPAIVTINVTVVVLTPVPTGITFNPSSVRVQKGAAATLNWTVNGMASGITCAMSPALPGGVPAWNGLNPWSASGNTAAITAPATYTLSCGNGTASTTGSASVGLVPGFIEI